MSTKIYVGNLSWNTTDDSLRQTFSDFGAVLDSIVMRDRDTGRSRGFGFVTYGSQQEATNAINGLNETELDGRRIKVNMANARPQGGYSSGGGGNYGGNNQNYGNPSYGGGYPGQVPSNIQGYGGYGGQTYGAPPPPGQYGNTGGYPPQQGYGGGQY